MTIGRYALTIGATDPSHYDPEAARAAGYADVVAPPNMLAADGRVGHRHTRGRAQGRRDPSRRGDPPRRGRPRAARDGRRRGDGARQPRRSPARTWCSRPTLEAITPKQTRAGPCVFVTTRHTFLSADGAVLNRNRRTVVLRNPVQES